MTVLLLVGMFLFGAVCGVAAFVGFVFWTMKTEYGMAVEKLPYLDDDTSLAA